MYTHIKSYHDCVLPVILTALRNFPARGYRATVNKVTCFSDGAPRWAQCPHVLFRLACEGSM